MFLVAPPHANACTGHNFVTNTPIKFIFAIAIEVPDYKNPMIFVIIRKNKMASGGHFVYKSKLRIDLKWWEMRSKVIFGHPKWPLAAILWILYINKSCVLIWNGEKCNWKWYSVIQNGPNRTSKMATGGHFEKKLKSCVLIWNGEKCDRKWFFSVIQHGRRQPFC